MAQGTIKSYDETAKSGVILDDHATEYAYDAESFRGTGTRLFRIGQRVRFTLVGDGDDAKVRDLRLITL